MTKEKAIELAKEFSLEAEVQVTYNLISQE